MACTDEALRVEPAGPQPGTADRGVMSQFLCLLHALVATPRHRLRLGILAVALVVVVCAVAYGQIKLNAWNGSFLDTLEHRTFDNIGGELGRFFVIVGGLLILVVGQTWLQETIKVVLREWLTHDLLDKWLAPKRPYLLAHAGEVGANPDQYMQSDARQLAELSATLGFGLLQSSLLLVSFAGVLWILSGQVTFTFDHSTYFNIPGYMLWCALVYSAAGSWLAWLVGRPLIRLNAERYAREADLRSALVRVHESAEAIAFHGGESDERRTLDGSTAQVIGLGRQLANGLARLTWITSGYGWLALAVPVIAALPGYMYGNLSLGGLTMVVGAFNQVQSALRWFVDNFSHIADWRATLLRVVRFRDGLLSLETPGADAERIAVGRHPADKLAFANLSLQLQDGRAALDRPLVEVDCGERVLIAGCPEAGKNQLLRALAGLWPAGTGTILLPAPDSVMFMPPRPYLPFTTLRAAITYPDQPDGFGDDAVHAALERVGLTRLAGKLAEKERWDKSLSADEQQRLALARLVLHRPTWVFFEDTTPYMTAEHCRIARSIFAHELAAATVIGIGSNPALTGFYGRTIHLRHLSANPPHPRFGHPQRPRYPAAAGEVELKVV
jgi:putative ATP-binding cassette transporter